MSIKLIVDSAGDIDKAEAENRNITLIPMEVSFGNETYFDGVNLSRREFFEKLVESDVFPKTSQINKFRFEEEFKNAVSDGSDVICMVMSSKLSATYQSAVDASKSFNGRVRVIDTKNACLGERILIDYAQSLIAEGKEADEIERELNKKEGQK